MIMITVEVGKNRESMYSPCCTILEDYIQLFISQMFPVIVSSFVDLNINFIRVFVWKIKSFWKIVQKVTAMFDW